MSAVKRFIATTDRNMSEIKRRQGLALAPFLCLVRA